MAEISMMCSQSWFRGLGWDNDFSRHGSVNGLRGLLGYAGQLNAVAGRLRSGKLDLSAALGSFVKSSRPACCATSRKPGPIDRSNALFNFAKSGAPAFSQLPAK